MRGVQSKAMTDEQIIEALATKLMGWRQVKFPALVTEGVDDGIVRFIVNSAGQIETRRRSKNGGWGNWEYFDPLTSPADSKQVREKLADLGFSWTIDHHASGGYSFALNRGPWVNTPIDFSAIDTSEERAVSLAALKIFGIEGGK